MSKIASILSISISIYIYIFTVNSCWLVEPVVLCKTRFEVEVKWHGQRNEFKLS